MKLRHDSEPWLEIRSVLSDGWVNFYGVMGHDEAYSVRAEPGSTWESETVEILAELLQSRYTLDRYTVRGKPWRTVTTISEPYGPQSCQGGSTTSLLPLGRWAEHADSRSASFECVALATLNAEREGGDLERVPLVLRLAGIGLGLRALAAEHGSDPSAALPRAGAVTAGSARWGRSAASVSRPVPGSALPPGHATHDVEPQAFGVSAANYARRCGRRAPYGPRSAGAKRETNL